MDLVAVAALSDAASRHGEMDQVSDSCARPKTILASQRDVFLTGHQSDRESEGS